MVWDLWIIWVSLCVLKSISNKEWTCKCLVTGSYRLWLQCIKTKNFFKKSSNNILTYLLLHLPFFSPLPFFSVSSTHIVWWKNIKWRVWKQKFWDAVLLLTLVSETSHWTSFGPDSFFCSTNICWKPTTSAVLLGFQWWIKYTQSLLLWSWHSSRKVRCGHEDRKPDLVM